MLIPGLNQLAERVIDPDCLEVRLNQVGGLQEGKHRLVAVMGE